MSTSSSIFTLPTFHDGDIKVHSCRDGVEYKGVMFISDKNASLPLTVKELWFCARNGDNGDQKAASKASMHLAKVMHTKEKLGCTYDKNIEELLKKAIPDMYAI